MTTKRILLISTGGTIAMTADAGTGIMPTLSGEDLVRAVPELASRAEIEVVSFSTKPGASLTLQDLIDISTVIDSRMDEGFDGAVVVQGTDTIEETAFALDLLGNTDRPVVVTGAMRGASAAGADGPANLLASVTTVTAPIASGLGVLVVLNDEAHAARYVRKSHTALPSAFTSPDFAPVGRIIETGFHLYARLPRMPRVQRPGDISGSVVALITMHLGDDGRLLSALPQLGYSGVVIEALGAGHLPARLVTIVQTLLEKIPVILSTRVDSGPVFTGTYGFVGSETDLIKRGVIPGGRIGGVKACLLLRLLLANGFRGEQLRHEYARRNNVMLQ